MKRNAGLMIRRMLCILLCIAMLPLVRVSAAGYHDVFQTLKTLAKAGETTYYDDEEVGRVDVYYDGVERNGIWFQLEYQVVKSGSYPDEIIVSVIRTGSGDAYSATSLYLFDDQDFYFSLNRYSESSNASGQVDSKGFYYSEAYSFLSDASTIDGGITLDDYTATVSESRLKADFKKDTKDLLEYMDQILRGKNSNLSIQDIFRNITPRSLHTVSRSWTEKAETCTEDGIMGYQCSVCGAKFYEPIEAHHNWLLVREDVPATDEHGSGEYRCDRCGETKTDVICISAAFTDMPAADNWAHPGIDWAVYHGITNGISATSFAPGRGCTRGQVVTFLWRAAGSPDPKVRTCPFVDVNPDGYYYKAMLWAVEHQITLGTSLDTFSPDATCTRGQIVTFLWRFRGTPLVEKGDSHFSDVKIGAYYENAVAWAESAGVTAGTSRTTFSPDATCTRAQVVTFLYRAQKDGGGPIQLKDLVGVSMPTNWLQRWQKDGELMKKLLQEAGYDVDLQYADNDVSRQISQVEKMVADGAKVIIVAAIDGDALGSALRKAKAADVKVIAYDRLIYGSDAVSYYATFDNWRVGELQGEYIRDSLDLDHADGKSFNIEFVTGDPNDNSINFFFDGAMSILRPYLDSGVLICPSGQTGKTDAATEGWAAENAQRRFENILSTFYTRRQLDAVMASNDSTAQGVVEALRRSYHNDVYPIITGQDCDIVSVGNMMQGKQAMSIFKETADLAAKTVEMADAIIKGTKVPVNDTETYDNGTGIIPSYLCEPRVCTTDNIQELLIDSGYYRWDDIPHR